MGHVTRAMEPLHTSPWPPRVGFDEAPGPLLNLPTLQHRSQLQYPSPLPRRRPHSASQRQSHRSLELHLDVEPSPSRHHEAALHWRRPPRLPPRPVPRAARVVADARSARIDHPQRGQARARDLRRKGAERLLALHPQQVRRPRPRPRAAPPWPEQRADRRDRSYGEFMTLFAKTVAERTKPGQRQDVEEQGAT